MAASSSKLFFNRKRSGRTINGKICRDQGNKYFVNFNISFELLMCKNVLSAVSDSLSLRYEGPLVLESHSFS